MSTHDYINYIELQVVAEDKRNQIVIWLGAVLLISLMFILMDFNDQTQVNSAFAFLLLFLASLGFVAFVELIEIFKRHISDLWKFWTANISKKNLKWLGFSLGGTFGFAYLAASTGDPIMGMVGSGIIMFYALLQSRSILIPIATHGTYNVVITQLVQAGVFSSSLITHSAIPVPVYNGGLLQQILWQFGLVANSEEFLKLAAFTWALFLIRGTFNTRSKLADAIAIAFAVGVWILYHFFVGSLSQYFSSL